MSVLPLQHRQRPMRLLLVEDNRGDVMLLKRAFTQSNIPHEITIARTGEEALAIVNTAQPHTSADIIILDLNLPGLSGLEVLQALKNDAQHQSIPIFVLSSSRAQADVVESYQSHANCYLVKPHDLDSLCEIVERIGQFWYALAVLPSHESKARAWR